MCQRVFAAIVLTLALLGSAASMAASVQVIPSTGIISGCCTAIVAPSSSFFVTLHAVDVPGNGSTTGTTGPTLTIEYDPAVVMLTGAALSPGSPFDFITTPTVADSSHVIITALHLAPGYASGTFDAFQVNFTAIAEGNAGIYVIDDIAENNGGDNTWVDQDANPIPMTYTQANVCINPEIPDTCVGGSSSSSSSGGSSSSSSGGSSSSSTSSSSTSSSGGPNAPLPPAAWLLASALGVLGWANRKASSRL